MNRKDYGPKGCAGALVLIVGILVALTFVGVSVAKADDSCQTFTTNVVGRPDSGAHGDWASDTFTRTTKACADDGGMWTLTLTDSGRFTTLAGALSPGSGAALPAPVTGRFNGHATLTVTVPEGATPHDPVAGADGKTSSSEWAGLVFTGGQGTISGWSWTYSRCGGREAWVNAETGSAGDVLGVPCARPTTTTTVSEPPASSTTNTEPSPSSSSSSAPSSSSTSRSSGAAVVIVPAGTVGAGNYGHVKDTGNLAYTGTSSALPYIVGGGALLFLAGLSLTVLARRRRANR